MTSPYEEGSLESKICILGEAPARTEMRQGRPLVGPSGQLLEQCLHATGMVRRQCYITNVFETQVRKAKSGDITDEYGDILWNKKGFSEKGIELSRGCRQRLEECKANVIVPLGGTATGFLLNDPRIMKLRGSILYSDVFERKVVPTIHPAASLRGNFVWRHLITSDLAKARIQSQFREYRPPQRTLYVEPSFSDCLDFLREIGDSTAFDTELVNQQIYCIGFSKTPQEIMCIPFVDESGHAMWSEEEELALWLAIEEVLSRDDCMKIAQNTIFDTSLLYGNNHILTKPPIADIMIAHHIIWPDFRKGLDFMCSMHTEEPYYKDERTQFNKVTDPIGFRRYNAKDSATTHEIWNVLQEYLADGYQDTYDQTMDSLYAFLYMMHRGIKVNREELERTRTKIGREIHEKQEELDAITDGTLNPLSPKQCQQYFYVTKGIKPYVNRSTGRPTTDDKAMTRIYRKSLLPEAKLVQEIRSLSKLKGTYLDVGIDKDNRVRCTYNLRGTVTGRPSSSQTLFGSGMNLQNLHPAFKGFLIADDD